MAPSYLLLAELVMFEDVKNSTWNLLATAKECSFGRLRGKP